MCPLFGCLGIGPFRRSLLSRLPAGIWPMLPRWPTPAKSRLVWLDIMSGGKAERAGRTGELPISMPPPPSPSRRARRRFASMLSRFSTRCTLVMPGVSVTPSFEYRALRRCAKNSPLSTRELRWPTPSLFKTREERCPPVLAR
jgi:hypothetical protein